MFEAVPLEALIRFAYALTQSTPELQITGLYLRAGSATNSWNADVSLAYWIVAPQGGR